MEGLTSTIHIGENMNIRRLIRLHILCLAVAFVTGCATKLPPRDQMKSETAAFQLPRMPSEEMAIVYVVRPSALGGLVRFNVFVDDQEEASEVGYTRAREYIYFEVKPGEHKVYSKAENWAENLISAKAGDIVFLQQRVYMGFLMARNDLNKIDETEGAYQVKNLTLGTLIKPSK